MLCKLITQYYKSDEIECARDLLFDHFPEEHRPRHLRKKVRQGTQKLENTVKDMVDVMHELSVTRNFTPPTFVTATSNFPSLDIGNVDAVAMTVEISEMRQEIAQLKQERNSEKEALIEIKKLLMNIQEVVNLKEVGVGTFSNSSTLDEVIQNKSLPSAMHSKASYATTLKNAIGLPRNDVVPQGISDDSGCLLALESASLSKNLIQNDWNTVKRPKPKNKPKIGKKFNASLKVVKNYHKPAEVFVSRFHPDTSEQEVQEYVCSQFSDASDITCEKLKTKWDSYASFKISMTGISFKDSLDIENWPEGIFVKRFYHVSNVSEDTGTNAEKSKVI